MMMLLKLIDRKRPQRQHRRRPRCAKHQGADVLDPMGKQAAGTVSVPVEGNNSRARPIKSPHDGLCWVTDGPPTLVAARWNNGECPRANSHEMRGGLCLRPHAERALRISRTLRRQEKFLHWQCCCGPRRPVLSQPQGPRKPLREQQPHVPTVGRHGSWVGAVWFLGRRPLKEGNMVQTSVTDNGCLDDVERDERRLDPKMAACGMGGRCKSRQRHAPHVGMSTGRLRPTPNVRRRPGAVWPRVELGVAIATGAADTRPLQPATWLDTVVADIVVGHALGLAPSVE